MNKLKRENCYEFRQIRYSRSCIRVLTDCFWERIFQRFVARVPIYQNKHTVYIHKSHSRACTFVYRQTNSIRDNINLLILDYKHSREEWTASIVLFVISRFGDQYDFGEFVFSRCQGGTRKRSLILHDEKKTKNISRYLLKCSTFRKLNFIERN